MTLFERIFHSVLFEIGAVAVAGIAVLFSSDVNHGTAIGTGILMALIAMVWNLIFNTIFDKIFTGKREERGLLFRIMHTICFEAGLLVATIPLIAYMLDLSLWQAFLMDIGLTLIIMFYALIFNWLYDLIRLRFVKE